MPTLPPRGAAPPAEEAWQDTLPGRLDDHPRPKRRHPPLTEVLEGMDVRELEGQTVFDQLFGPRSPD